MAYFILLVLPYVFGLGLLALIFTSLKYLPYVVGGGIILFAISWLLG